MFTIMSADEAVKLSKDNACIGLNAFHAVGNPEALHEALEKEYRKTLIHGIYQ